MAQPLGVVHVLVAGQPAVDGLANEIGQARSGDKRFAGLLADILPDAADDVKMPTIWTIGELSDPKSAGVVIDELRSASVMVCSYAAHALARIGSPDGVEALSAISNDRSCVEGLFVVLAGSVDEPGLFRLGDKGWQRFLPLPHNCVGLNAIYALGQIRSDNAIDPLIRLTASDNRDDRMWAVDALGNHKGQRAVDAIVARLSDHPRVGFPAVAALGRIGSPQAIEALQKIAETESDESVKQLAQGILKASSAGSAGAPKKGSSSSKTMPNSKK